MLEKVRFKNFKSFAEETLIDFAPGRITYLSDTNIEDGLLKGIGFYGSNASGKTNALFSITLLLDLLFKDLAVLGPDSFSLFSAEKKMAFEYSFRFGEDRIVYSFEFTKGRGFTEETLFLNGKIVLERTLTSAKTRITENPDFDSIEPMSLFLRSIYFNTRFAGQKALAEWFTYLQNSIFFNPIRTYFSLVYFDKKKDQEVFLEPYLAKHGTEPINAFFKEHGFPFTISYDRPKAGDPLAMAVPFQARLLARRENMAPVPFYMESMGLQMLLGFLPAYLSVIEKGGILAIDEFSSGLHNDLEELLVSYFFRHAKKAQLVFVSHSTNLLKTSLLRPDQVYSVEFGDRGSYLNKFSQYGLRESQNMEKMYLSGAFGGLPCYEDKQR